MTYNAIVKFSYINDSDVTPSKYFTELVDRQTITVEAPASDLNVHQYFELFKGFLRAVGFDEYNIMDGACRLAFTDANDETQMKKLADEYELILAEDFTKRLVEYETEQDEYVAKLEDEVSKLKEKLARVLPEQYVEEYTDEDPPRDDGTSWNKPWNGLVPGSPEAVANSCKCPILDNEEMPDDKKWVNADCPLHGKVK